jgi:hydrogenase expression/formation protein
MSDLEGLTRNLLKKGKTDSEIIQRLIQEYHDFKDIDDQVAKEYAMAILEECKKSDLVKVSDPFIKELLGMNETNITVGEQGVGCRGAGDFFVHKLITNLSETRKVAFLSPSSLDDAGAVRFEDLNEIFKQKVDPNKLYVVSKMEGIHSRLSDFPFICGFHVTRAALRDLFVKGARPISILIDAHLADDADVGKLFDFMAGVSSISELTSVPITAGSTLRIGGDMVIGDRFVGGIGAIGLTDKLLARRNIQSGDRIIMTEGAGGGTITTAAIYSGNFEIVKETLNIKFLKACELILNSSYLAEVNAMCDVTNGGLRGDLHEINYEAHCGTVVYESAIKQLVNEKVYRMLGSLGIDYLGVSLDALLIYCSSDVSERVISDLIRNGIKSTEIGYVDDSNQVAMVYDDNEKVRILPRFRESAYTKIKQVIGEATPDKKSAMEMSIESAARDAIKKREKIVNFIKKL